MDKAGGGFRLAKVLKVHPEHHTVDLMFLDNGGFYQSAHVMAPFASTNTGTIDLPTPTEINRTDEPRLSGDRDMLAGVMVSDHAAYVVGFFYPEVNQLCFADKDRKITRHASDVYTTVDQHGNTELYHPSGTYIRIGENSDHEDLTGKDFDKKWKITKNTDRTPALKVIIANGGQIKSSVDADSAGNVTVNATGKLIGSAGGDAEVSAGGVATVKATVKVVLDAPLTETTGPVNVGGDITSTGNIQDATSSMQAMRDAYNDHDHPNPEGGVVGKTLSTM